MASPLTKLATAPVTTTKTATQVAAAPVTTTKTAAQVAAAAPAVQPPAPYTAPAQTAATAPPAAGPTTVFVNNSQEYGSFQQMAPPGSTLLFQPEDPGWPAVMAAAQAAGFHVGIWIPQGQGPSDAGQYGQYMATLANTYHPAIIVSNAETASKNQAWNDTVTAQLSQLAPQQKIGLAVEPNQTINYKDWTSGGGLIYVENFNGAQQTVPGDPAANVVAQGVPSSQVVSMGYRSGAAGSQFAPTPNWWVDTSGGATVPGSTGPQTTTSVGQFPGPLAPGSIPPEHGNPVTGTSGPAGPLPPGSIPPEHGNPQTGGPTGAGNPPSNTAPAATPTSSAAGDWASYYFGSWGLDTADMNALVGIMGKYADANDAVMAALAYIRGTQWYATHFPGIQQGIQKGLFSDEAGYRSYVNELNQYYNQYLGRNVSADETVGFLGAGQAPSYVKNVLQGQAYVQANSPEIQYEAGAFTPEGQLSPGDLTALGNEQSGIDTALGQKLQLRLQQATQRMQTMFGGSVATPSLNLGSRGLNSPSLQGQKGTPDIAA